MSDTQPNRGMSMSASRAMRPDEPLMIAWAEYQRSDDYVNTVRWAGESNVGGLWAAFMAGWLAAGGKVDAR